jgi:hypothetical protein
MTIQISKKLQITELPHYQISRNFHKDFSNYLTVFVLPSYPVQQLINSVMLFFYASLSQKSFTV